jgi:hypothetical protein
MGLQKPNKKPEKPEWVSIYITHNLQEAHIVAGRLGAHDILSMIHTVPGASAIGITIGNLGEINILIHPYDYDKASDILFPEDANQLEDNTDKVQYIWQDDGDGEEYYIDDDEDDE